MVGYGQNVPFLSVKQIYVFSEVSFGAWSEVGRGPPIRIFGIFSLKYNHHATARRRAKKGTGEYLVIL